MANTVLNWVWDHSRSKHGARLVLLAIADRAREDGRAEMGVADLKRRTQLKERAVQGAVIELAELGELEVGYREGRNGVNRYRVIMAGHPAESAPPQDLRGADNAPPQDLRDEESSQASGQDPAKSAPPAESAPPQNSTPDPAESADKPKEPHKNSPTESSKGGVGGDDSSLFGANGTQPRRTRAKPTQLKPGPEFERFYNAYPVHKARGDAEKAWMQATRAGADPEVLIAAALRYRQDPQVVRGYGKYPAGWLRAKCWLDEATETPPPGANGTRQTNYTDEEYHGGW